MKVTIVPIVIGALGTVTKGLLKGLEDLGVGGRLKTIQTTPLLRTVRDYPNDSIAEDGQSADVKNTQGVNNENNNKIWLNEKTKTKQTSLMIQFEEINQTILAKDGRRKRYRD